MKFKLILPTRVDDPRVECPMCHYHFQAIDAWGCGEESDCPNCGIPCTEIIE